MHRRKRLYYIVSHVHKSMGFEWTAMGLKNDYDLTFILLNAGPSSLETFLISSGVATIRIPYRDKKNLILAWFSVAWVFIKKRPQVVHAHLFDASLVGLSVAWFLGIRKRIYTRHNSTYHHLYFPGSVKYDRWMNRMATHIVSISQATDVTLLTMENVPARKLKKIPHGFDLSAFDNVPDMRISQVRIRWNIPPAGCRIGVIARHIEWKGIQFIIGAFKEFLKIYPSSFLILANASGPYHEKILQLLSEVPATNFALIPFEEDIPALYKSFDLYVHTPIDSTCEAFGQTYVEALAAGVPSVFTASGIAAEFVTDGQNALLVDFQNSASIFDALKKLWQDKNLQLSMIEAGKKSVDPFFSVDGMLKRLRSLYEE